MALQVNAVPDIAFPEGSVTVVSGVKVPVFAPGAFALEPVTVVPKVTVIVLLPFQATLLPANFSVAPLDPPR